VEINRENGHRNIQEVAVSNEKISDDIVVAAAAIIIIAAATVKKRRRRRSSVCPCL